MDPGILQDFLAIVSELTLLFLGISFVIYLTVSLEKSWFWRLSPPS